MNWLKIGWFRVGILIAVAVIAYSIYYALVQTPKERAAVVERCYQTAVNARNSDTFDLNYRNCLKYHGIEP